MDQVDKIIIGTLNSLGCEVEDEVCSLSQFGLEEVVRGVVSCLRVISPDRCAALSHKLPHNMAQRFRAAAAIAQEVKSLGYSGDLGYQSLLYPNEVDIRRLFSYLLEQLPRDAQDLHQEPLSGSGLLLTAARKQLQQQLEQPWLPPHCRPAVLKRRKLLQQGSSGGAASTATELLPLGESRHLRPYRGYHLVRVGDEGALGSAVAVRPTDETETGVDGDERPCVYHTLVSGRALLCSVLAAHASQLQTAQLLPSLGCDVAKVLTAAAGGRGLDSLHKEDFLHVPSPSTDSMITPLSPLSPMAQLDIEDRVGGKEAMAAQETKLQQEEKMKDMQAAVVTLERQKRELLISVQQSKEQSDKLSCESAELQQLYEQLQTEVSSLQRTLELLPASQENKARLEAIIGASDAKMARLKEQFRVHCAPLQDQLKRLNEQISSQQWSQEQLGAEVQRLRGQRQVLVQETPRLQAQADLITEKLKARGQAPHRSVYTKRIHELTASVHQQRLTTEAVLLDIRKLQKEINNLAGKIDRSFTVIEEVSYKASWSNSASVGLYHSVISLHDACNDIVDVIRETGAIKRQVAELNEQVVLEERRETGKALAKLQEDLAAVKQENAALKSKIGQASAT